MVDERLYKSNLACFKEHFPDMARLIAKPTPNQTTLVMEDGKPTDLELGSGRLYKMPAEEFARQQLETYFANPERIILNYPEGAYHKSPYSLRTAEFLMSTLKKHKIEALMGQPKDVIGYLFVFGVGLGYRDVEFDAFNVPRGQRVARFEEYLALVKRLWTEDNVSHEGDMCVLDNVTMHARPVQQPHPPIWIAANNDGAIRRAARLGDAWFINPHATLATLRDQMRTYRGELERCGKPFPAELPLFREIFCARDRALALELAVPHLFGKYEAYAAWGQDKAMPEGESFDHPPAELLNDRFILGSPEECFEQLRPYWEALGTNHLVLRTHWAGMPSSVALSSMELISNELLPELRKVEPGPPQR